MYLIQKEVDVYHRVPGSSGQKTDLFAFGEHPTPNDISNTKSQPNSKKTKLKIFQQYVSEYPIYEISPRLGLHKSLDCGAITTKHLLMSG